MKVLMAANVTPDSGGVASHISRLSTELRLLGCDIKIVWGGTGRLPGGLSTLAFSARVAALVRRGRFDILHTHGADGVLAQHMMPLRTAAVVTSHGDERVSWDMELGVVRAGTHQIARRSYLSVPWLRLPMFSDAIKHADLAIALHQDEARRFMAERVGPVRVVANGCSPSQSQPTPRIGRILYVGSWNWRKGADLIPRVFAGVRSLVPGANLVVAGPPASVVTSFDEPDQAAIEALGWCDESTIGQLMSSADVLLMTSRFEGMPLVALEAMSWGVPVVAFEVPGLRPLSAGSRLVASGDVHGLTAAISETITDRELRAKLSEGASSVAANLTWRVTAERTLAAYHAAQSRKAMTAKLGRWSLARGCRPYKRSWSVREFRR